MTDTLSRTAHRTCTGSSTSLARRLLVVSALAVLAGCTTPVPVIGDPALAPMAPGEGALALSMLWSSPMPAGMRAGPLTTFVEMEPVGAGDGVMLGLTYGGSAASPVHYAKRPTPAQDMTHVLLMQSVKPGRYWLKRIRFIEWGTYNFEPGDYPPVTVRPGEVTYMGNLDLNYTTRFKGIGVLSVGHLDMSGPNDQFARDTAELKATDKRLESVVFTNAYMHRP